MFKKIDVEEVNGNRQETAMSLRQEQEEEADVKGHTESIKPFNKAVGAELKEGRLRKIKEMSVHNPLLIENIVEGVVKYLDYGTKKSLREVHSCWNNAILTPEYMNRTVLKIHHSYERDFSELFEAFPIQNPTFKAFPATLEIYNLAAIRDAVRLLEWLGVYGNFITTLKVYHDIDQRLRIFEKMLTGLLPNLQHLRIPKDITDEEIFKNKRPILRTLVSLDIGGYYYFSDTAEIWPTQSNIVRKILSSAINLKVLKMGTVPESVYDEPLEPLLYLWMCRDCGDLTSLVELDMLEFNLTLGACQMLSEVKFKNLKRMVVPKYNCRFRVADSLVGLLENIKDTVEYVRLDAKYLRLLPRMKQLIELKCDLTGYERIASNNYISQLPKLQTLIVESERTHLPEAADQMLETIFEPYHRNESIKSLELINVFGGRRRLFEILGTIQNLKCLKITRSKIPRTVMSLLESFVKERGAKLHISGCTVVDQEESDEDESAGEDNDE